jgi:hypothetical protein
MMPFIWRLGGFVIGLKVTFSPQCPCRHKNSLSSTRTKFISLLHRSCLLHLIGSPEKVVVKGAIMSHCEKVLLTNGAINSFD